MRRNKHGNTPTRSRHTGRMFQSKLEASREPVLLALQNVGEITGLEYQTPFAIELYSTQAVDALLMACEEGASFNQILRLIGDVHLSRQKVCTYKADYAYHTKSGALVVEDVKGYDKRTGTFRTTPEYRLKRKLMVLAHNIEIVEPDMGGVAQRARGCGVLGKGTGSRLRGGR